MLLRPPARSRRDAAAAARKPVALVRCFPAHLVSGLLPVRGTLQHCPDGSLPTAPSRRTGLVRLVPLTTRPPSHHGRSSPDRRPSQLGHHSSPRSWATASVGSSPWVAAASTSGAYARLCRSSCFTWFAHPSRWLLVGPERQLASSFNTMTLQPPPSTEWYMDTGAETHMTSNSGNLCVSQPPSFPLHQISLLEMAPSYPSLAPALLIFLLLRASYI